MSTRFHQRALEEVSESVKMDKEADAAFKAEYAALLRLVQEDPAFEGYTVAWRHEGYMLSLKSVGTEGGCCCMGGTPIMQWEITIDENEIWTVANKHKDDQREFSGDEFALYRRQKREEELRRVTSVATQLSVQWGEERERKGFGKPESVNSILHRAKVGAGKAVHQQTPAERAATLQCKVVT